MLHPIPFFMPQIGEEEIEAVTQVMRTGQLVGGKETAAFEKEFAEFLSMPPAHAVSVNSATAGLHLCLVALGVGPGDDVLVPTVTFSATAEVVERVGARPILVDIEPDSYCMSPDDAQRKITSNTKAIMPVHHSGRACDMRNIWNLAQKHALFVIEDAAHAFPTRYEGKLVGALESDATVFSFYANKTMTTGDGGMIVSRRKQIADTCRKLRWHGIRKGSQEEILSGNLYDVEISGYKYNMTEMEAAMGRIQLRKVEFFAMQRRDHVSYYRSKIRDPNIAFPAAPDDENAHPWHVLTICFKGGDAFARRNRAIALLSETQIGFSVHYRPLHQHSHWQKSIPRGHAFPVADEFYKGALSLPLYPNMSRADIDRVCAILKMV